MMHIPSWERFSNFPLKCHLRAVGVDNTNKANGEEGEKGENSSFFSGLLDGKSRLL